MELALTLTKIFIWPVTIIICVIVIKLELKKRK